MTRRSLAGTALLFLAACADTTPKTSTGRTQREADSVIGQSRLPGATGVRGAIGAADSAAARRALQDSIANAAP